MKDSETNRDRPKRTTLKKENLFLRQTKRNGTGHLSGRLRRRQMASGRQKLSEELMMLRFYLKTKMSSNSDTKFICAIKL